MPIPSSYERVELTRARDRVLPVADAVPDVDVEHRRGDRGRDEHERDDGADRYPDPLEEPAHPAGVLTRERRRLAGLVL